MLLQYMTASFHLPSVSTANINTMQYPKPYQQYKIPTIPAAVISKLLHPQSNIKAAFVHSHSSLLSDVSTGLPKYSNYVTQYTILFSTDTCCWPSHTPAQNIQLPTHNNIFILSMPHRKIVITLFILVKNYECWIMAQ